MADPVNPIGGERDVLAGELALGVLQGEERTAAQQLLLADRDFAAQVRWWNYRLACMAEEAGAVDVGEDLWPAIVRRLAASPGGVPLEEPVQPSPIAPRRFSGWSLGGAMAGAAAAAAVVTLMLVRPQPETVEAPAQPPVSAPAGERLVAQLQGAQGAFTLAGLVETEAARISLNISGLAPQEGAAPELWVVPEGGAPISLGRIPAQGTFDRALTPAEQAVLIPGSALAVTYEDTETIPNDAPGGEILAVSPLSEV